MLSTILLIAATLFTPPALMILWRVARRSPARNHCTECRFDLSGIPDRIGRCPECGSPRTHPGLIPPYSLRRRLRDVLDGLVLLVPVTVAAVLGAAGRLW